MTQAPVGQSSPWRGQNGHHHDCDAPEEPYYNYQCSLACPLRRQIASDPVALLREWLAYSEGMVDGRQLQSLVERSKAAVAYHA